MTRRRKERKGVRPNLEELSATFSFRMPCVKIRRTGPGKNIVQGLGMLLTFERIHTYMYKHVLMYVPVDVNATEEKSVHTPSQYRCAMYIVRQIDCIPTSILGYRCHQTNCFLR